jgi:hypothetical protein
MVSNENDSTFPHGRGEPPAVESYVERIRKNDKSLTWARIQDWESDAVETLDALKNNTVVDAAIFT